MEKQFRKLKNIVLKNYKQFLRNVDLNLTYPEGHEFSGKPLNKICIIGQSATGKTTLLKLIKDSIENRLDVNAVVSFKKGKYEASPVLINLSDKLNICEGKFNSGKEAFDFKKLIVDLNETDPSIFWVNVLENYKKYKQNTENFKKTISKKIQDSGNLENTKEELQKLDEELIEWEKKNPNQLAELNDFLEPFLSKTFLQLKEEPENIEELTYLPLESIQKEYKDNLKTDVSPEGLSSGIRQILARLVPLFVLNPKRSIILIDEPENSLYPDIQKLFVEFLSEKFPDCQFIYSTQSTTIASCFDPWETIDLKFNENGKVYQEIYFKEERHIDNYTCNVNYINRKSIFQRIFNFTKEKGRTRRKKVKEFAQLNMSLRRMEMQQKRDFKLYRKLYNKRIKMGEEIEWDW